jgi:hypothetical protein
MVRLPIPEPCGVGAGFGTDADHAALAAPGGISPPGAAGPEFD